MNIGWFLYLTIPALAAFLAARPQKKAASGAGTGCLVAGIGLLVVALPIYLLLVTAPTSTGSDGCHGLGCGALSNLGPAIMTGIVMLEGWGALFGGLLGGLIGGLLGRRYTSRQN